MALFSLSFFLFLFFVLSFFFLWFSFLCFFSLSLSPYCLSFFLCFLLSFVSYFIFLPFFVSSFIFFYLSYDASSHCNKWVCLSVHPSIAPFPKPHQPPPIIFRCILLSCVTYLSLQFLVVVLLSLLPPKFDLSLFLI